MTLSLSSKNSVVDSYQLITDDLTKLVENCEEHSLVINPTKFKVMLFGNPSNVQIREKIISLLNFQINSVALEFVDSTRNLGLVLDK